MGDLILSGSSVVMRWKYLRHRAHCPVLTARPKRGYPQRRIQDCVITNWLNSGFRYCMA
jgi:hypothetical protein